MAANIYGADDKVNRSGDTMTGQLTVPDLSASGLTGATAGGRFVGATGGGSPVSGTFALGDFCVDQTGSFWVCTAAGSPGGWVVVETGGGGGGTWPGIALGDTVYGSTGGTETRLPGNTAATRKFLRQLGTGSASAAPAWDTLQAGDLPAATTSAQGAVVLDGTSGDIAALGAQAAGSIGKAADAGHVHPTTGVQTAVIDTTAADIAALGTRAAGSTGKLADAGHVHPTTSVIDGVTVSGAAVAGNVITATSPTAAIWQTPAGGVTLDTTAADIAASPATQAAGSIGKAADSGHVHPQPPMFAPTGLTGATSATRFCGATASGHPTTGTFAVGDFTVDQTGSFWVCTSAGTPGTWTQVSGGSGFSNPMTTLGDLIYGAASGTATRLAGSTSATKQFLTQTGTGSASAAPAWGGIASADMPTGTTSAKGALQLDGTATDIAALGTQAAGSSGLAADAKHVHPTTGLVTSVAAGDTSIVVGGTSQAPTLETGTLDVIATDHPPAAAWSNNSKKITSVANGSAASDAAAFGQIPTALPPNGSAGGVLSGTYPNPGFATTPLPESGGTMTGWLAPAVSALTFVGSGTTLVNAALGNAFNLTLTASTTTLGAPANPVDGQVIRIRVTQGTGGSFTLAYNAIYDFGAAGAPTLSTTAGKVDILAFEYVASISKWCYLGSGIGY